MKNRTSFTEQGIYQIRVKAQLDPSWSKWLDDMEITTDEDAHSILTGYIPDQPALYGLIIKLRDLGMSLISVCRLDDERQSR